MQNLPVLQNTKCKVARLKRSKFIRLISINDESYTVYGSTGTIYTIKIEPSMNCTCIDFKKNKNYCKHIYFIFLNIYKIIPQLDKDYSIEELKEFHNKFLESKSIKLEVRNEDDPCSICFEIIEDPFVCKICRNGFHQCCINDVIKFSKKSNCPLCRGNLNEENIDDLIKRVELL